jgi:hypothetical protein
MIMEKMRGMKGILTHDEEVILKALKDEFEETKVNGGTTEFEYYINGFLASARLVALEMKALPGQGFLDKLEELAQEVSETMDII